MPKRYGFMLPKGPKMLKIGDKVLERGGIDVHIIKAVREKDKIYDCVRMRDDRERRISFQNAVKTKRSPQMLVRCFGSEYISNVERAMRKSKIKYTMGGEDGRHDVAKFFVEEKDLEPARVCLDNYYKNGEDLKVEPSRDITDDDFLVTVVETPRRYARVEAMDEAEEA